MARFVFFLPLVFPVIGIGVWAHMISRPGSIYRAVIYFLTTFAILFVVRMNLADAPPFPVQDDWLTRIAAAFKGIVAPPGTTTEEPGTYFPASAEFVCGALGLSLIFFLLGAWNSWRIAITRHTY